MKKNKKRYTVHVEGHIYCPNDEATYRILAASAAEARKKAEEKFINETGDWDFIESKISTRRKKYALGDYR